VQEVDAYEWRIMVWHERHWAVSRQWFEDLGICAALFLQQAVGPKWQKDYVEFWERSASASSTKTISRFHRMTPVRCGWDSAGFRPRSGQAYQEYYSKGAYVLAMLRSLMYADMGSRQSRSGFHLI